MKKSKNIFILFMLMMTCVVGMEAEDGSSLWLRNSLQADMPAAMVTLTVDIQTKATQSDSATLRLAAKELMENWSGAPVTLRYTVDNSLGKDCFSIEKVETTDTESDFQFVVSASSPSGILYGVYFLLRAQSRHDVCLCTTLPPSHKIQQKPYFVSRCIVGQEAIFDILKKGRIADYARANASIGINGIILTPPRHPSKHYQEKVSELAAILQPYCISIYQSGDTIPALRCTPVTTDKRQTGIDETYIYHATVWRSMMLNSSQRNVVAHVAVSSQPSWCPNDNHLEQANWFAFGRLAWDPTLLPEQVAHEWLADTFSENPLFILPMRRAMTDCDGTGISKIETLLNTWREAADAVDEQRHTEVENALNAMLEQLDS